MNIQEMVDKLELKEGDILLVRGDIDFATVESIRSPYHNQILVIYSAPGEHLKDKIDTVPLETLKNVVAEMEKKST